MTHYRLARQKCYNVFTISAPNNLTFLSNMYDSLKLPWSGSPDPTENAYRSAGLVKTQGTIFLLPPHFQTLSETFNAPPKPKSLMSAGAVALCKHFERGGASSEHSRPHPFWPLPRGSNENKTILASQVLAKMMADLCWRNVLMLHPGVAVYEIRNSQGYGMRWTLNLVEDKQGSDENIGQSQHIMQEVRFEVLDHEGQVEGKNGNNEGNMNWMISKVSFRGFLEPIIGLDHELP